MQTVNQFLVNDNRYRGTTVLIIYSIMFFIQPIKVLNFIMYLVNIIK